VTSPSSTRVVLAHLVMDYPPTGNGYKRHFCTRSSPRAPHPVRAVLTKEATAYKRQVASAAIGSGLEPVPRPRKLSMEAHVYRPRAIGDIDNTLKVLQDSLEGIVFENDGQIHELYVRLHDDEKDNPRVEVTFYDLP
jgi:Holliday junction resolvase RusA-like endonuclease